MFCSLGLGPGRGQRSRTRLGLMAEVVVGVAGKKQILSWLDYSGGNLARKNLVQLRSFLYGSSAVESLEDYPADRSNRERERICPVEFGALSVAIFILCLSLHSFWPCGYRSVMISVFFSFSLSVRYCVLV